MLHGQNVLKVLEDQLTCTGPAFMKFLRDSDRRASPLTRTSRFVIS